MHWRFFYNVFVVPFLWITFHILGIFDKKIHRGIQGRKHLFESLQGQVQKMKKDSRRIWFHSSSMGEFEQAKPIIAELKKRYPDIEVIVTFFSPSGFEHTKSFKHAAIISYMPFDSVFNAKKFIKIIQPTVVVMMRYDVWPNHLWQLQRAKIPTFIANATLKSNALRNIPIIKQFLRAMYNALDYILTVSEEDKKRFEFFNIKHPVVDVIGDTRYDQVWQRSAESRNKHILPSEIISNKKVFVVGSSWHEDEEVLLPAFVELSARFPQLLMVLVPHEPTIENLERIENMLNGYSSFIRFSNLNDYSSERIIIIDSVGILMPLYQYAHVAYIGGSFRQGVHNVLEPAVYGVPLIVGHKYENSQEAVKLIEEEAMFVGKNTSEIISKLKMLLTGEENRTIAGEKALLFVKKNVGATNRFFSYLEKVL
jgi:3-deoxy-D-manno-octulosonic-acid transferase